MYGLIKYNAKKINGGYMIKFILNGGYMIKFILDGKPVKGLSIGYNIPENIKIGECI
jgi:hypothetical protein